MYSHASRLPVWRLRTGKLVHLLEGCFLPPSVPQHQTPVSNLPTAAPAAVNSSASDSDSGLPTGLHEEAHSKQGGPAAGGAAVQSTASVAPPAAALSAGLASASPLGIGPAALDFMCRHLPLFDVPWSVKVGLEAAGVGGLRIVSPAVLRPMLRSLMSAASHVCLHSPSQQQQLLSVQEALEVLHFCTSDLVILSHSPHDTEGDGDADSTADTGGAGGRMGGTAEDRGPATGTDGTAASNVRGLLAREMGLDPHTLMAELSAGTAHVGQMFNYALSNLNELIGSRVGGAEEGQGAATGGSDRGRAGAAAPAVPGAGSPAAARAGAASAREGGLHVQVDFGRLGELRGLPVPTAAGTVVPLGEAQSSIAGSKGADVTESWPGAAAGDSGGWSGAGDTSCLR
ncbi:hypothetical protein DUNSADRAFT_5607, partial [Dunaliella salina]